CCSSARRTPASTRKPISRAARWASGSSATSIRSTAWMNKAGIPSEGGPDGVTVLKQSFDVQPLVQKQADCISVMTYNELDQALHAGFTMDDLKVFNYTEMGNDMLEDGLYVIEDNLKDAAFKDKMVRFVKAS